MDDTPAHVLELRLDPEQEPGVYANLLSVWHTAHEFTFDFASMLPEEHAVGPDGRAVIKRPARVVARVKVPPTVVFDIIRTINENLTAYERTVGQVSGPDRAAGGER